MVKREIKSSVPEEHGESKVFNENGKRTAEEQNNDGIKKPKTFGLYRQPTAQELNRLQETESLFNSNLFRLQVDEILQEVKVKEKTEKKFTEWFANFKNHLLAIPEDDNEYDLTENTLSKRLKVKLPISSAINKTKCMFRFHKFHNVEVVGSYSLGCSINSKLKVDLQITVPADTYTKNDSVNYRYHKKQAAYLAYIASHIIKTDTVEDVKYSYLNGSETHPVLDLKPSGKLGNQLTVQIRLACETEAYKFHRFSPSRNNLRESWLLSSEESTTNEVGPPTPHYNSRVLQDLTALSNQEFLSQILSKSENLKQAVVLLKIWLRQRNLQVSGHVVSLLVAYFVQIKRINNIMSSYQIVRNVWIALKTSELDKQGISLHKGSDTPSIKEFHKHFPMVFLDCTGYYNICWNMCKGTYDALKREASLAIDMLDNGKINSFIPLFMTPIKPLLQFDHILKFKNFQAIKEAILSRAPTESKVNFGLDQLALVTDLLHALLVKGLGDRVELVLQMVESDFSCPVKKTPEKAKSDGYKEMLSFGLILNVENAMKVVEKGPPANLPEAEEFRAFWGDKSELRRFQDSSITEACVWAGDSAAQRRTIPAQIVDYLLGLKYGVSPSGVFHVSAQLDGVTARKQGSVHVEESSLAALHAFDALRRDLRQLTQLPLDISAVYGVSPVFSYSCPLPGAVGPAPLRPWQRGAACLLKSAARPDGTAALPPYTPVCEAVIELGHSGKWPGDIQAFRCLKAAFHLQIADRLSKQYSLPTQAYPTHIDVLKNGLVFRLKIAHPKEITLVQKEMENGVAKFRETEESVRLQCDTVLVPRLRGALHGIHTKHPSFGPTVCLFKRWLACHLLSPPLVPPTVAELVCARVFTHPHPLAPPASPTLGLVRVLQTLVRTDWATEVVLLDFNEDLDREEISQIEQQLCSDPARPSMCLVTAYDGGSPSVWSRAAPTAAVLGRARALAAATLGYLETQLMENMNDNVLGAFIPSLAGYDVTIRLHPHLVPHYAERLDQKPEVQPVPEVPPGDVIPVVEFNPVEKYLDELRSAYSEFAVFFHDQYGGDTIAVLWKPDINEHRDFQVLSASALTPVSVKDQTKYVVNTGALVEDFKIIGRGLVHSVTVHT